MADFSISATRDTLEQIFTQGDITVGTQSPNAGAVELRIDRTSSGHLTVKEILLALEKFENYFLTNGFLYSTAPGASTNISEND
jgi:hypothetical protein